MNEACVKAAREPVSHEVISYASRLASISDELAERVDSRLSPVARQSCPKPESGQIKETREYPPLFDELRGNLFRIEQALKDISDTIDRTEL